MSSDEETVLAAIQGNGPAWVFSHLIAAMEVPAKKKEPARYREPDGSQSSWEGHDDEW